MYFMFFFSSRRRHTRWPRDWSSDVWLFRSCSSMAVKSPQEWQRAVREHPDKMILGLDLKNGKMAYGGWLETSDKPIEEFLNPMIQLGLKTVLSTDISRDGMLSGPNGEMYIVLQARIPA